MRKWNAWISIAILALFFIHAIAGSYQIAGYSQGGVTWLQVLSWIMLALIVLHVIIGLILTVQTIRITRKAGVAYRRENRLFWTRRISGIVVIILVIFHIVIFATTGQTVFRLNLFAVQQLLLSLLLVAALLVHVLSNIRPLFISTGIRGRSKGPGGSRKLLKDVLFVIAVILLFSAFAFIIYYLRWNVFWL